MTVGRGGQLGPVEADRADDLAGQTVRRVAALDRSRELVGQRGVAGRRRADDVGRGRARRHAGHPDALADELGPQRRRKPANAKLGRAVDRLPRHALQMAQIQHEKGIKGTYYWRIVPESYDEGIIKEVVALGHELGYHYEDLTLAKGDPVKAIELFKKHLDTFRQFYPVKSLCMHGSPLTKWDNREIWKDYNYTDYGLTHEPYFDTDFNKVFYLTDTGRQWNNATISVRDKVESPFKIPVKSTFDIIEKLNAGELPEQVMHNVHPHRWTGTQLAWMKELVFQNAKNLVKRLLIKVR